VREDPDRKGLLYAGTEFGLYVSLDDGVGWQPLQLNLPITPITDLAVKRGDLVVATQGRSYWILDDLSVLHQLTDEVTAAAIHLFEPRPAVRWVDGAGGFGGFSIGAAGSNPPYGAVIHYVLPEGPDADDADEVKLEILDGDGEVLRSLSSTTPEYRAPSLFRMMMPELFEPALLDARKGANRFVWNLRLADAKLEQGTVIWGMPAGPQVPPGTYQARLTVGEWNDTVNVEVVPDPRIDAGQDEMVETFELAKAIWKELARSHEAIGLIRDVRGQAQALAGRVDDEEVGVKVEELSEALTAIEVQLNQTKNESSQDVLNFPPRLDNQLVALQGTVESAVGRPTEASAGRFEELVSELDRLVSELDAILDEQLPELERLLIAAGAPRIVVERGDAG
jgi:hypothetical protein